MHNHLCLNLLNIVNSYFKKCIQKEKLMSWILFECMDPKTQYKLKLITFCLILPVLCGTRLSCRIKDARSLT